MYSIIGFDTVCFAHYFAEYLQHLPRLLMLITEVPDKFLQLCYDLQNADIAGPYCRALEPLIPETNENDMGMYA